MTMKIPPPPQYGDCTDDVPLPRPYNTSRYTQYVPSKTPNFLCPFCLMEIYTGDIRYFCNSHKHLDNGKAKTIIRKVFKPEEITNDMRRTKKQIYCCNDYITANRLCPNCVEIAPCTDPPRAIDALRSLPHEIYKAESNEFRLCLTGFSRSGKTGYITQLLDLISNHPLPGIDSIAFLDERTQIIIESIRNQFSLDGKLPLKPVPSGFLDPLIFNIRNGKRSYTNIIYDTSSEDFMGLHDTLSVKCIGGLKNVILFIDPTTLPSVQYHPHVVQMKQNNITSKGNVIDSLLSYINIIKTHYPKPNLLYKHINLAVVFTKMDLFYDDDDFPELLKQESIHRLKVKYSVQEMSAVHHYMERWISENGGSALIAALRSHFPNARLFGVSNGSEHRDNPNRPNRIIDPFLWLLYQNRVLPDM